MIGLLSLSFSSNMHVDFPYFALFSSTRDQEIRRERQVVADEEVYERVCIDR